MKSTESLNYDSNPYQNVLNPNQRQLYEDNLRLKDKIKQLTQGLYTYMLIGRL